MKSINLYCPITPNTGYGVTSTYILKELAKNNNVSLFPIGGASVSNEEDKKLIQELISKTNANWSNKDPCLKIWHQYDLATRIGNGKYGALIFFETDKLNPIEKNMINNTDIVFVASEWGKNILLENDISVPIIVSPLAVDTDIFDHTLEIKEDENRPYRFINIGKWEIRKGHDILVEAFNKAFNKKDNVELIMMNDNPFLNEKQTKNWIDLYQKSKLSEKIKHIPRVQTHSDLAKIIKQCDCGIFPARAEGWNNEILEVMAMNKPVIATNYSAHTEYCNKYEDNSYLIDIENLVPAKDDMFFNGFGNWADLGTKEIDQIVEKMKHVYKNNIKDNPSGLKTAKRFNWSNTSKIISEQL